MQWSDDSQHLAFVSTSRDHSEEQLRIADAATGDVRDVFEENVADVFRIGQRPRELEVSARVERDSSGFPRRDNWGQLVSLRRDHRQAEEPDHHGRRQCHAVLSVDEKNADHLYFLGVGREKGRDPYFIHFYRVGFDGSNLTLLTPEDANHDVALSPDGKYFVDTYSKPDVPPVSVLRDDTGQADRAARESRYFEAARHRMEAADPVHGEGARRRDRYLRPDVQADQSRSQRKSIRSSTIFIPARRPAASAAAVSRPRAAIRQALAELGFIVVEIDGMGTPWRSKKFHEAYYGDMGDNTLPDQVAGMKQLAQKYPWIDIDRAGIYGHSGGGYATADAMFRYPDFFKVGISESGNHDNREYEDDWGEKWQGLLERKAERRRPTTITRRIRISREESEGPSAAGARHHGHQCSAVQHAAGGE